MLSLVSVHVAGTLIYRLKVDHIYQRRFGKSEMAEALKASHWYIVTRRPSVRIIEGSQRLDDYILTVDISTRADLSGAQSVHTLGVDFGQADSLKNFQVYANGAYFSVEIDGNLLHGDAWSLSSFLSKSDASLAAQEVLYIGEAFGKDGSSNAWNRISAHEKLQRIYEDHADVDCDIFVAPLSLERRAWMSDDHIDDDEDGPSYEKYYQVFATESGSIRKASVDLIEHSLISYFKPYYNENLRQWRHEAPTKSMRLMRDADFRLAQVHLSGWWGLARFYSSEVPDRYRSHLISHDLPPEPKRPVFRGVAAENLSDWRHSAIMVREGQELLEQRAERTGVMLRAFGEQAPSLRTPPGIVLPTSDVKPTETGAARAALRDEISEQREQDRRAKAPIMHPNRSTYDPESGTIVAAVASDGSVERLRLCDASNGKVDSRVIFGDSGMGKSNHLLMWLMEARLTGFFRTSVADVAGKGEFRSLNASGPNGSLAEGVDECITLLEEVCRVIEIRRSNQRYRELHRDEPAILLGIDDVDSLLHTTRGASLVRHILVDGGTVGVGIALVVRDITNFEMDAGLMSDLIAADQLMPFTEHGDVVMQYLKAKYYWTARFRTWGDDEIPLFVVHQDAANAVLGMAVAWLNSSYDEDSAKDWASGILSEVSPSSVVDWQRVSGAADSWYAVDIQLTWWFLRRHQDVWLLLAGETNAPNIGGPDLIAWANYQVEARFEANLAGWHSGPSVPGSITFYSEVVGDIARKDRTESVKNMIADMY